MELATAAAGMSSKFRSWARSSSPKAQAVGIEDQVPGDVAVAPEREEQSVSLRSTAFRLAGCLAIALAIGPRLAAAQGQTYYVTLEWTAPGDDGMAGQASQYQLHYSTSPVGPDTSAWYASATVATGLPYPSSPGTTDSVRIQGLSPGQTYYFVL